MTGGTASTSGENTASTPSTGHVGHAALAALRSVGTEAMFTLNGGHLWPLYEAARDLGVAVYDTRHEQTATFAAEAAAKLTRRPGLAALTAGPGITNGISAVTTAAFNGSPLVVLGGRAPQLRWGSGSLQELDHVPLLAPVTKAAHTLTDPALAPSQIAESVTRAMTPHRGPVFMDFPLDVFAPGFEAAAPVASPTRVEPDADAVADLAARLTASRRPGVIVGSDVYWAEAWESLRDLVDHLDLACFANGLGRGLLPVDHRCNFSRTRRMLSSEADLVVVVGTPLDFRLGFGTFGDAEVVHVVDADSQRARHVTVPTVVGDLDLVLRALVDATASQRREDWILRLREAEQAAGDADRRRMASSADPIAPARIYGELARRLEPDAVVICDGGDFASYAGKYVEVKRPGTWLDTGPYGCLGNGLGYALGAAVTRPSSQIVVLLGDGAAGFSLMDVDTLVRHGLPVVMVVGNNGIWGLEKHPMQAIYGWDLACDLQPGCRYDEVARALGGAGETIADPEAIGAALDRGFASGVPYLVNVLTDPADVYPRSSNLA